MHSSFLKKMIMVKIIQVQLEIMECKKKMAFAG